MAPELQNRVDKLLEEFMNIVDAMARDRHLQKGIARSQLPSSMVAMLACCITNCAKSADRTEHFLLGGESLPGCRADKPVCEIHPID